MKTLSLVGFMCLLAAKGEAQPNEFASLSYGFSIIPSWNYAAITNKSNTNNGVEASYSYMERPFFTIHGGADFYYAFNRRWVLCTGVHFIQGGVDYREMDIYYTTPEPSAPTKVQISHRYQYVHVPLEMKVYVHKGLYVQTGPGVQMLINPYSRVVKTFHDGRIEIEKDKDRSTTFRQALVSYSMQAGYTFNLNGRWKYTLGAYSSFNLMGVAKEAQMNRRFYCLGAVMGVQCNL